MRLVCLSDTHSRHQDLVLPEGDVLIHAGDATMEGLSAEVERFLAWFASQPHPHKILIAGNHDWLFQRHPDMAAQLLAEHPGITYLQDSGTEKNGVRFWGSPWQPWFYDWAFNLPWRGKAIREVWNRIPLGTDVLITHGPPHGLLDQVGQGDHLGCEELTVRLATVQPRIHIFGHIHDGHGIAAAKGTTFMNACTCDEDYRPTQKPLVMDLHPDTGDEYFDNLLEQIYELRLSQRLFYQKLTDLYALSVDYLVDSETTKRFYDGALAKLAWAIKSKPQDLDTTLLDILVGTYLDLAESRARRRILTTMENWAKILDEFIDLASEPDTLTPPAVKALATKIHHSWDFWLGR